MFKPVHILVLSVNGDDSKCFAGDTRHYMRSHELADNVL
jgi:hypothetical protein